VLKRTGDGRKNYFLSLFRGKREEQRRLTRYVFGDGNVGEVMPASGRHPPLPSSSPWHSGVQDIPALVAGEGVGSQAEAGIGSHYIGTHAMMTIDLQDADITHALGELEKVTTDLTPALKLMLFRDDNTRKPTPGERIR